MFALGQTKKKKTEESKVRQTKKNLKDVNITDTIEKDIRKEQHDRDQNWKKTGRDQIKKNTNFDMARSLFGGGGGPDAEYEEEEVDEVAAEVQQLSVDDDEEDLGEPEVEEYVEEEVVEGDEDSVEISDDEDEEWSSARWREWNYELSTSSGEVQIQSHLAAVVIFR